MQRCMRRENCLESAAEETQGKESIMRRLPIVVALLLSTSFSFAQDTNNPEELKKSLADALNQLKAAQDRKNELAMENEKLKAKIADQQKEVDESRRIAAECSQKTWLLRSQFAAWETFLKRYPKLKAQWDVFLEADPLNGPTTLPAFSEPTTQAVGVQ
jgi:septal ring factor EnvC (AmiA/AmiB activator)